MVALSPPRRLSGWCLLLLAYSCSSSSSEAFSPIHHLHASHQNQHSTYGSCRRSTADATCLFSLVKLTEMVQSGAPNSQQTVFVGGKGGVGKTTVSSALAVQLAASDARSVLIVSTDPAHSLGDALDVDLRSGEPVRVSDDGRLYAQEIDATKALADFRENLAAFDVATLAKTLQVSPDLLESLGLAELSGLLNNPPPGLDELVAMTNVFSSEYDVVVVDTAPTGHTLRLLQLPKFLDGLLGKLIALRLKLSGIAATLQAFLGSDEATKRAAQIDSAVSKLEDFKEKMSGLQEKLQDHETTRFCVVTVPTVLGVAESKRLVTELASQNVRVTDIVVNQCVVGVDDPAATTADENAVAMQNYYQRRVTGQQKWIGSLTESVNKVSASQEYQSNGESNNAISVTQVPFFDVELVGVAALGYVGSQVFTDNTSYEHLLQPALAKEDAKVVICGGKGGVGKTTTSSALAVTLASAGHKVALISTDPAHSLGDAVSMNLAGGKLQTCPLIGVPGDVGTGSLSVLEIDPSASLDQFKGVVDQLMGDSNGGDKAAAGLRDTLKDLQEVFDTLPAGTDEVVALGKIVNLVKNQDFDRIILDTAPTGHTLRMLSTPGFLAELIDRLLLISDKINSNTAVKMFLSTSGRKEDIKAAVDASKSKLLSFQFQMYDLEDLFANAEQTEFLIVTVPTELAVRESIRLLNDLTFEAPDMPIKVRNVVVNQVLRQNDAKDAATFLSHVENSQNHAITDLEQYAAAAASTPIITKVPYLDTEPRGVFGLKFLASELLKEAATVEAS